MIAWYILSFHAISASDLRAQTISIVIAELSGWTGAVAGIWLPKMTTGTVVSSPFKFRAPELAVAFFSTKAVLPTNP